MIGSVPEQFWGLFGSKNRFIYMEALRSVNEEYQYNNYFISQEAAQQVIEQCFTAQRLKLEEEENETDLERCPASGGAYSELAGTRRVAEPSGGLYAGDHPYCDPGLCGSFSGGF